MFSLNNEMTLYEEGGEAPDGEPWSDTMVKEMLFYFAQICETNAAYTKNEDSFEGEEENLKILVVDNTLESVNDDPNEAYIKEKIIPYLRGVSLFKSI